MLRAGGWSIPLEDRTCKALQEAQAQWVEVTERRSACLQHDGKTAQTADKNGIGFSEALVRMLDFILSAKENH